MVSYFTDDTVNPCDYTSCSIVDSTGATPSWVSGFVFTGKYCNFNVDTSVIIAK